MLVETPTVLEHPLGHALPVQGKAPRVAVYTLGCKLNYADGLSIRKTFEDQGYEPVSFEEGADVYIINTCSVTDKADRNVPKWYDRLYATPPTPKWRWWDVMRSCAPMKLPKYLA